MNTGFVSLTNRCWNEMFTVYNSAALIPLDLLIFVSS